VANKCCIFFWAAISYPPPYYRPGDRSNQDVNVRPDEGCRMLSFNSVLMFVVTNVAGGSPWVPFSSCDCYAGTKSFAPQCCSITLIPPNRVAGPTNDCFPQLPFYPFPDLLFLPCTLCFYFSFFFRVTSVLAPSVFPSRPSFFFPLLWGFFFIFPVTFPTVGLRSLMGGSSFFSLQVSCKLRSSRSNSRLVAPFLSVSSLDATPCGHVCPCYVVRVSIPCALLGFFYLVFVFWGLSCRGHAVRALSFFLFCRQGLFGVVVVSHEVGVVASSASALLSFLVR